ncbi:MAG: hypothetical protein ACR2KQ_01500 [Actinomycetota bacterium]
MAERTRRGPTGPSANPALLVLTTLVIAVAFSWTFFINPNRPPPREDLAYYTWRTEALIANDAPELLGITGPLDMYSNGYRVATPVTLAILRQTTGISFLKPTILLTVGLRIVIPLLLAGFAYKHLRDPLAWHAVALSSAGMLLFPPFAGYIDNMFALAVLAASLFLLDSVRTTWRARFCFITLLFVVGITHPTTLVIFIGVLCIAAFLRFLVEDEDRSRVVAEEVWVVGAGLLSLVVTYVAWKGGLWGPSASPGDAALPPPAPASFFKRRLTDWIGVMRPVLNLPLVLFGAAGSLAAGRKALQNDMVRMTVAWLTPLVGVLGLLVGAAYPYYRFFNTTLAWVLLAALGVYYCLRFALDRTAASRNVSLLLVPALALLVLSNLFVGYRATEWNDPRDAWVTPEERVELDAVRTRLGDDPSRPVIFVVSTDATEDVRIYGFAKRAGNVTRYAIAGPAQPSASYYLGSFSDLSAGKPSAGTSDYYRSLSASSLDDVAGILEDDKSEPLFVVLSTFNTDEALERVPANRTTWVVQGPVVDSGGVSGDARAPDPEGPSEVAGGLRFLATALVLLLLLGTGWPAAGAIGSSRREEPVPGDLGLPVLLGLVPALALGLLAISGTAVLAVTRAPMSPGLAWISVLLAAAIGLLIRGRSIPSSRVEHR